MIPYFGLVTSFLELEYSIDFERENWQDFQPDSYQISYRTIFLIYSYLYSFYRL